MKVDVTVNLSPGQPKINGRSQQISHLLIYLVLLITIFSNTVSKSINMYTANISVGGEGNIQKCTRHHTWDAPFKTTI